MAGGIPEQLGPEVAALYGTIGGMISSGIGADRAYHILRSANTGIPRATVRRVAGEVRQALSLVPSLARLPAESLIPRRYAALNSSLRTSDVLTHVTLLLRDINTGFTGVANYTYVSDTLPTPGEAMGAAQELSDTGQSWEGFEVLGMAVTGAMVGPNFGE